MSNKLEKELINQAKDGDDDAFEKLLKKYEGIIEWEVGDYKGSNLSYEDTKQMARLAFWKAVRDYEFEQGMKFQSWLYFVLDRKLAQYYDWKNRQKRKTIDYSSSLDRPKNTEGEDDDIDGYRYIEDDGLTAEEKIMILRKLEKLKAACTELEWKSVYLSALGYEYVEVAEHIGAHYKAVDNAIQRARKKTQKL